jgi:hypothetical protein
LIKPLSKEPKNLKYETKIILVSALMAFAFFISCSSNESIQESIAITSDEIVADADIDGAK